MDRFQAAQRSFLKEGDPSCLVKDATVRLALSVEVEERVTERAIWIHVRWDAEDRPVVCQGRQDLECRYD